MTETELKITIKKEDFQRFIAAYQDKVQKVEHLWNIFLETPDRSFAQNSSSARIRSIDIEGQPRIWVVTIKGRAVVVDGFHSRSEHETEVSEEFVEEFRRDNASFLRNIPEVLKPYMPDIPIAPVLCYADCSTTRTVIPIDSFVVEADEVELPNGDMMYELEIETDNVDHVREVIVQILGDLSIPFEYSTKGKAAVVRCLPLEKQRSPKLLAWLS
mgnify:CR=1 FL=1